MTKDDFLEKVIHNKNYEYLINSDIDVIKSHDLVKIKCKEHNTFLNKKYIFIYLVQLDVSIVP
jgi:hypothetical protein